MSIIATIQKPDEFIPFCEFLSKIPTYHIRKPKDCDCLQIGISPELGPIIRNDIGRKAREGYQNHKLSEKMVNIETEETEAISLGDLNGFLIHLNNYIDYVNEHMHERTPEKILREMVSTENGRMIVEVILSNSNTNPECVEPTFWAKLKYKYFKMFLR